ncbi:hypothetical protein [uncultured Desulfosarcina sp.]|uniref:hypothetical protein n=1 Tax=uncultured Desulfosarcina sp. TaxID=218289 RepID=UPI0029C71D36|nr:hypothetical protein [uncultured Desulfosarcina sp.]
MSVLTEKNSNNAGLPWLGRLFSIAIALVERFFSLDGLYSGCYKLRAYTNTLAAEAAKHCIKKAAVRNTSHEGVYPWMGFCFRGFLFVRQSAFLKTRKGGE